MPASVTPAKSADYSPDSPAPQEPAPAVATKASLRKSDARVFIDQLLGSQARTSRLTVQQCQNEVILLAIKAGLKFAPDDFVELRDSRQSYRQALPTISERHYSAAAGLDRGIESPTCCVAIEKLWNRKPFTFAWDTISRRRICVGLKFWWKGLTVECTSFASDGGHFTACSYKAPGRSDPMQVGQVTYVDSKYRRIDSLTTDPLTITYSDPVSYSDSVTKIDRRFTITIDDLREAEKASKATRDDVTKNIYAAASADELTACLAQLKTIYGDLTPTVLPIDKTAISEAITRMRDTFHRLYG